MQSHALRKLIDLLNEMQFFIIVVIAGFDDGFAGGGAKLGVVFVRPIGGLEGSLPRPVQFDFVGGLFEVEGNE